MKTLDEFLEDATYPNNAYVTHPDFKELYVRRTRRFLDGVWVNGVLDIARIEAKKPGDGCFTRMTALLLLRGIPLYIECVHNQRFADRLERMGYTRVDNSGAPSFYRLS